MSYWLLVWELLIKNALAALMRCLMLTVAGDNGTKRATVARDFS